MIIRAMAVLQVSILLISCSSGCDRENPLAQDLSSSAFILEAVLDPQGVSADGKSRIRFTASIPKDSDEAYYVVTFKTNAGSLSSEITGAEGAEIKVRMHAATDTSLQADALLTVGTNADTATVVSASVGDLAVSKKIVLLRAYAHTMESFVSEKSVDDKGFLQATLTAMLIRSDSSLVSLATDVRFRVQKIDGQSVGEMFEVEKAGAEENGSDLVTVKTGPGGKASAIYRVDPSKATADTAVAFISSDRSRDGDDLVESGLTILLR